MLKEYYSLTKPGIIYGNALSAAAGFLLASQDALDPMRGLSMLLGISCIVGSGCVFNNYLDRDIDARMERTRSRALVRGAISTRAALIFGGVLGVVGIVTLLFGTTLVATMVALVGWLFYVIVYSAWSKRYTVHATVLGAIAGAVPPVVGYTALAGTLDLAAGILFLILMFWQIPHALAIAIYRLEDYAAASIPVLPLSLGMWKTKLIMLVCAVGFAASALSLYFFGYAGISYAILVGTLAFAWILITFRGFVANDGARWAKKVFRFSLILILAFCLSIAFNRVLP